MNGTRGEGVETKKDRAPIRGFYPLVSGDPRGSQRRKTEAAALLVQLIPIAGMQLLFLAHALSQTAGSVRFLFSQTVVVTRVDISDDSHERVLKSVIGAESEAIREPVYKQGCF